ncbi:MAG: hypothetical protein IJN63_09975 [Clostridia bacterium]|nr:hypothetical protein [Clostridia bacterium]
MTENREQLVAFAHACALEGIEKDLGVFEVDCKIVEHLLDHCEIIVPMENRFFVKVNCGGVQHSVIRLRKAPFADITEKNGLREGRSALAFTGDWDFGHTCAEWDSVISLGIFGLRERIARYSDKYTDDAERSRFYACLGAVYDAALRFIQRAANEADAQGKSEMAEGLRHLAIGAPTNIYEAMQLSLVYYTLQQFFDGTFLRTLGRLDELFYPFYKSADSEFIHELCVDFIREIDRLKVLANLPFALGGTDVDGRTAVNELSYAFLSAYRAARVSNVKIHLLCSDDMPRDILEKAMDAVRNGDNSIVFMSDERIINSLIKLGEEERDARRYHVVGCYECGGYGEITCSCNARVNIPKALELALFDGVDVLSGKKIGLDPNKNPESFEELFAEFVRQLEYLVDCAVLETDSRQIIDGRLHGGPIISGTYTSALEKGADIYCGHSAKYDNSSINALGLATAVDSLYAIKKLVFEDKSLSLQRLKDILRSDWAGEEVLRLKIKNRFAKYGNDNDEVDGIAREIVDVLANSINGRKNAKGGVYRLGTFSIDWRHPFGEKTCASADGRRSGEALSQNSGATFGADKNGATAHLTSVSKLDTEQTPNGTIVDIDLHSSAVVGKNGLDALVATLKTYFDKGGFAVHYNVLDTEVLKDAKLHPERYPNLQVRLCGWNVLFSSLSEKEKDEFIARSMRA